MFADVTFPEGYLYGLECCNSSPRCCTSPAQAYIQRRDDNNDLLVKVGGWGVVLCVCCNALPLPMICVLAGFAVLCYAVLRQLDSTDTLKMCVYVRAIGACGAVQRLILLCHGTLKLLLEFCR
jgi:hypothetical protein